MAEEARRGHGSPETADGSVRLGYLVPQFPGQTHTFFWREIGEIERRGGEVALLSTRLPPRRLISHGWSEAAIARTAYLGRPDPLGTLQALAGLSGEVRSDIRGEGPALVRDALLCLSPARRLARIAAARGIGHVHVHSCGRAALIAALANRMSGLSYSLTLHGPLSDYGPGQRLKWRHAAFATVITAGLLEEARAALGADMPARLRVQPMGVDVDAFARTQAYRPPGPGEPIRLFSCGRLSPIKGHQDLMQAVRILADGGLDVRLEIAGEDDAGGGGFRRTLEARLDALDLGDRVRLLGAVSEAEVREKLLEAHMFVLASWHEPLGVAYMEAMSCALPTIGTDAGGVRELFDARSGLLVPPKDPEALAAAIAALARDPKRAARMGRDGRARVAREFRASAGARTLLEEIAAASSAKV